MSIAWRIKEEQIQGQSEGVPSYIYKQDGNTIQTGYELANIYNAKRFYRADVSTPNFLSRYRLGDVILNPLHLVKEESDGPLLVSSERTSITRSRRWPFPTFENVETWSRYLPPVLPSYLYNEQMKSEIHEQGRQKLFSSMAQAFVTIAEWKETVDLILGAKKRFMERFISVFRNKSPGRVRRALDASADTWLEYRYGWRPLIADIENFTSAYKDLQIDRKIYFGGFGGTFLEEPIPAATGIYTGHEFVSCQQLTTRKLQYAYKGYYRIDASEFQKIERVLGLGDILGTAWELVPFSFVVDRFINIGDFAAANVYRRLFHDGTEQVTTKSSYETTLTSPSGETSTSSGVTILREINPPLDLTPEWNPKIDAPFSLDLAALAYQIFKK